MEVHDSHLFSAPPPLPALDESFLAALNSSILQKNEEEEEKKTNPFLPPSARPGYITNLTFRFYFAASCGCLSAEMNQRGRPAASPSPRCRALQWAQPSVDCASKIFTSGQENNDAVI